MKKNGRKVMEKRKLTQVPYRKAIIEIVNSSRNRQSLQHVYSMVKLLHDVDSNDAGVGEEDLELYFLFTKLFMLKGMGKLKAINSFINTLL